MKFLFVLTRADEWGGAQVHVRDLSRELQAAGHDVVLAVGQAGRSAASMEAGGLRVVRLRWLVRPIRPFRDLASVVELWRMLRVERPDVVSLHSSKAGMVGRVAAWFAGAPALFTAHGWAFTEGVGSGRRWLYKALERWMAPLAQRIITVSEYDRRLALGYRVGHAQQLVTVHNGMPDVTLPAAARVETDAVRVVMVARFSPPKEQQQLLEALAKLRNVPWRLEFIGDGDLQAASQQRAQSLGFAARVTFSGQVDDVAERLQRSDLFVLITNWEGLPRSIIEAMRAGLPVVATDVGGIGEQVRDGENGYLIPRGDTVLLAQRLKALLEDAQCRQRMGVVSRRRYEADFSFDKMYAKMAAIYAKVAANKC